MTAQQRDDLFYLTVVTAEFRGSKRQVHKLRLRRNLNESQRDAAPKGLVTNFSLLLIKSCRPPSAFYPSIKRTSLPKRSLDLQCGEAVPKAV